MVEPLRGWRLIAATLEKHGGTLTPSELAALTGMADSNVRLLLRRMATYGTVSSTGRIRKNPPAVGHPAHTWTINPCGLKALKSKSKRGGHNE